MASIVAMAIVWFVLFYQDIINPSEARLAAEGDFLVWGVMPVAVIFAVSAITLVLVSLVTKPPSPERFLPEVEPTPFVPEVASLRDFLHPGGPDLQGAVFHSLLRSLDRNYHTLLAEGAAPLLERYRDHSMVIGEEVTVCTEASDHSLRLVGQGRVVGLGGYLELILENRSAPITGGRLIMGNVEIEQERWASEGGETAHNHPVPEGFCHA